MEYVRLGNSGLKVSQIILGGMSFGSKVMEPWILTEEESLPIIKHAFDKGINTWDTADVYSFGDGERVLGKALKEYNIRRDRVVIMTKCFGGVIDDAEGLSQSLSETEKLARMLVNGGVMVNRVGLSRKHILDAVDASVQRLGTYIDVLQIHRRDPDTPREETMRALNDVIESGKVRYIGASSMPAWEFQALQNVAKQNGWHQFISMQAYHSLIYREEEREMFPYCRDAGVGVMSYSPLARGFLTRPWGSEPTARQKTDIYTEHLIGKTRDSDVEIIRRVEVLSKKLGVTMSAISLAWSIKRGTIPIVGFPSIERIDQALESLELLRKGNLTEEDMKDLDENYFIKEWTGIS